MHPLVSVIVPVYKVEDCLKRCLDSLCRQSLNDIEVLLVDDASPDRCGDICEEYAAQDERFRVIHHAVNRGLSAARNTGIAEASAEYLMFVDSDDWVHEDFCKAPYEYAVHYQADLVLFGFKRVGDCKIFFNKKIGKAKLETDTLLKSGVKTKVEALDLILFTNVGVTAWNKLYHKKMFRKISYPVGYLYEDRGTTYKVVLQAASIYYLNKVLYYKCYHEGSITTSRTRKKLHDSFIMSMQRYRDLAAWGGYPAEKLDLLLIKAAMTYCIGKKRDYSDPDYAFCANVLQSYKKIPKDFTWKRKVLFVLFKNCTSLFELVCTLWGMRFDQ